MRRSKLYAWLLIVVSALLFALPSFASDGGGGGGGGTGYGYGGPTYGAHWKATITYDGSASYGWTDGYGIHSYSVNWPRERRAGDAPGCTNSWVTMGGR